MKVCKFYLAALCLMLASISFVACSDDDPITPEPENPENPENPDPQPGEETPNYHFDIWVSIGGTGGMGADNTQLVKSLPSLQEGSLDFVNNGVDITSKLHQETIIKGKYYYQLTKDARFGKYQLVDDKIVVVKEFPFTTLKERRFTHAWVNDKTLVLIGSNGDSSKVLWVKVDVEAMDIINEGFLDLPEPDQSLLSDPKKTVIFNTSGIASGREDGKILYSFVYNNSTEKHFYMAFINATDMSTEKIIKEDRAEFMAGTAYGELLQKKSFFTKNGDYYLACNNNTNPDRATIQRGTLLRIKKGETAFDPSYIGYKTQPGKIVTVDDLGNGKVLLYIQDPEHTGAPDWGSFFNCYYATLDLQTDELVELDLPYCSGTFSQRSVVVDDKAYIGVYPENEEPSVYVYDIPTGELTKGLTITQGYGFDRIVYMLD